MTLPQEIIDKIFLYLDCETLENTREIQSEYVKKCTKYSDIRHAAKNGNIENMKWLRQQGCPWNTETFMYAAQNENLENMKWLKEQGCPWDSWTFKFSIRQGNLNNIKWIYSQGCSWDNCTFYEAIACGNLNILKFLHSKECPWNGSIIVHKDRVSIIPQNYYPVSVPLNLYPQEVLEWLKTNGYITS